MVRSGSDWKAVLAAQQLEFADASFMRRYGRAVKAYEELVEVFHAWHARAVTVHRVEKGAWTEIQLRVTEGVPDRARDLVQDVLQHFSAVLEQLAQALALHEQGQLTAAQKKSVTFPTSTRQPKGPVVGISLLPAGAQAEIMRIQPWAMAPSNPDQHLLARFDDLSRTTRHRSDVLSTAASGTRSVSPGYMPYVSEMTISMARVDGIGTDVIMAWRNDSDLGSVAISTESHFVVDEPDSPAHGQDIVQLLNELRQVIARTVFLQLLPYLR